MGGPPHFRRPWPIRLPRGWEAKLGATRMLTGSHEVWKVHMSSVAAGAGPRGRERPCGECPYAWEIPFSATPSSSARPGATIAGWDAKLSRTVRSKCGFISVIAKGILRRGVPFNVADQGGARHGEDGSGGPPASDTTRHPSELPEGDGRHFTRKDQGDQGHETVAGDEDGARRLP